jgi:hypothetical protein
MFGFQRFSSALSPGTDLLGGAAEGPLVNIPLEFGREKLK